MPELRLNRKQLKDFLPDHESVRQFERVFEVTETNVESINALEALMASVEIDEGYNPDNDPTALTPIYAIDQDVTVGGSNGVVILMSGLTTNRTINLPPANVERQRVAFVDTDGSCSGTKYIMAAANGTDTINNRVFAKLGYPFLVAILQSNGKGKWIVEYVNYAPTSAGVTVAPIYTDNGDGTVTIGDNGGYSLATNADGSGRIQLFSIDGGTYTLPNLQTCYLVADYASGSPLLRITTDVNEINETTIIPVRTFFRNGTHLHQLDWDELGVALTNKIHQSIVKTNRFRLQPPGLVISEVATRTVLITAGKVYYGATAQTCETFNSSIDEMDLYYHSAGVWTKNPITQYNNTQWDDGTNLQTLTNNRFGVNFVYRVVSSTEKHSFIVLGRGDYKISEAIASQPPTDLPPEIASVCVLVGRIIVEKGIDVAYSVESAFETNFVQGPYINPQPDNSITKEVTGFADPINVIVTYDSTARTITLTGSVSAYYQGVPVSGLVPGWVSPAHNNTNGTWFLLFNGTGFVWQSTPWSFYDLMIAYVYYGVSDKFGLREVHGMMPWQSHKEFHETVGTYRQSGGGLSGYVLASTTAADRRPGVSATLIQDEDLLTTVPLLPDDGPYTQIYLTSTGTSTFATAAVDIVPTSGGTRPYWNQYTAPNWVQTLMANNTYMSIFCVAVPASADIGSQAYRFLWVQGQTNGNLISEQSVTFQSLNLGQFASLFTEFIPIAKVILRYVGANWYIYSIESISGTRNTMVTSPAGAYLTAVTHDATMQGLGTISSPLSHIGRRVTTVAGLPATPVQGYDYMVTDANATTFASIVVGGGANAIPVYYDGTNWRIG